MVVVDRGLLGEDDALLRWSAARIDMGVGREAYLGDVEVSPEETPVDVRAVPDVWIVIVCSGHLQDLLHQVLVAAGFL